ncbi:MAG: CHAT domain-containing protein [bacterium]
MKHTILYVAANPRGTDKLALDRECEALQHELRLTADRDQFEFHSRWVVGVDQLMRALNETSPAILHFSGHGTGSVASSASWHGGTYHDVQSLSGAGILLEGLNGAQHVGHRALAEMIASVPPVPRLVVLNACHSADVADSLCEVVDCVVGMDDSIEDAAALEFTVGFYRALGYRRHSIGTAVRQARATMSAKQLRGQLVTCHSRNGTNADDIYLAVSSRAPDLGDGPVRERAQCESPPGNGRTSEQPAHEAREVTGTTTVRATFQPMGPARTAAVAGLARNTRDGSTTRGRAVSRPIGPAAGLSSPNRMIYSLHIHRRTGPRPARCTICCSPICACFSPVARYRLVIAGNKQSRQLTATRVPRYS